MQNRTLLGAVLLAGLALTSCGTNPDLTSITVSPGTVTTSETAGLVVQFTAIGSYTRPGHVAITKDITSQVTWSSTFPQFVTVNSSGLATVTGYGYGTGSINAAEEGFHGILGGSGAFTISAPPTTSSPANDAVSLLLVPHSAPDGVQFTALGRTQDGTTIQLSSQPRWVSTDNMVATIDASTGLASRVGPGTSRITAIYTNPDGTQAVGVTSLNVAPSVAAN